MKKWLATLLVAVCILTLVGGCGESSSTGDEAFKPDSQDNAAARTSDESTVPQTGNVVVRLHDAPSDYALQAVLVTIEGIEVHSALAEQEQEQAQIHTATGSISGDANQQQEQEQEQAQIHSGTGNAGWIPVTISGSRTIDVLKYQDGLEALLGVLAMEAGKYTQVRLTVSEVEVFYTSESGTGVESSIARIPSGQWKFVRPFNILAGGTTVLSFDFDVDKSINFTGSGEIIVKPVIKLDVYREGNGRSSVNRNNEKGNEGGGSNENDPVQNGTAVQNKGEEKDKNSDESNNSGNGNNSGSSDSSSNGNGSDHGKGSNPGKGNAFGQSTDEPGKPDKPGKPE